MKELNIALLQLLPGSSWEEIRGIGEEACRRAKERGSDIALFPEMWSCGYRIPEDPARLKAMAVARDDEKIHSFSRLAKELDMAIGVTLLESWEPSPRNSLVLFDRKGQAVLSYAKAHTCDFGEERRLTRGENFPVATLETAAGPVQVGAMICYDREFPESARILMLRGAELVLVPNACPMEINRLCQLRARAFENMMAIATCNYPAGQPDCNGHSTVFDGVAYLEDLPGSRDCCILEAGEEPGIYLAKLDLAQLRAYREREVHGNAYRRPELYHPLTDGDIREPFLRGDRR